MRDVILSIEFVSVWVNNTILLIYRCYLLRLYVSFFESKDVILKSKALNFAALYAGQKTHFAGLKISLCGLKDLICESKGVMLRL